LVIDEDGKTCGVITDGDVRRTLTQSSDISNLYVKDVFTRNPKSIQKEELAATALSLMEQHKITVLVVNSIDGYPEGIVHLHDLLRTGI
jgi:arabinose-5-phosphate isomerase